MLFGSGDSAGSGGTIVRELQLQGAALFGVSRVVPVALSVVIAAWVVHHVGSDAMEPVPLASVLALSLCLRLVFEENLHNLYYFMALSVMLVLLDAVAGRIRGTVLAWLGLMGLFYGRRELFVNVSWGATVATHLPAFFVTTGMLLLLAFTIRKRFSPTAVVWLLVIAVAYAPWPIVGAQVHNHLPHWARQLMVVGWGASLAVRPLLEFVRRRNEALETRARLARLRPQARLSLQGVATLDEGMLVAAGPPSRRSR
jgi:hypothetical protein